MCGWSILGGEIVYECVWGVLLLLQVCVLCTWAFLQPQEDICLIHRLKDKLAFRQHVIDETFDYMFAIGAIDLNTMAPEVTDTFQQHMQAKREAYDVKVGQPKLPFGK